MTLQEAQRTPMSAIMAALNLKPIKTLGDEAFYASPLHDNNTHSLVIDGTKWQDTDTGTSGDTIAFVRAYLKLSGVNHNEDDAIRWIKNMTANRRHVLKIPSMVADNQNTGRLFEKRKIQAITNHGLIQYLANCGISLVAAQRHLVEMVVRNRKTRESFSVLANKNEEGGYFLFKPNFNGLIGKQGVVFIRGNIPKPPEVNIFYDMMDYLTYLTIKRVSNLDGDTIVLTSMACLYGAGAYIANYGYVKAVTCLPNDKAGLTATKALGDFFKGEENLVHRPLKKVYAPCRTIGDWHRKNFNLPAKGGA